MVLDPVDTQISQVRKAVMPVVDSQIESLRAAGKLAVAVVVADHTDWLLKVLPKERKKTSR